MIDKLFVRKTWAQACVRALFAFLLGVSIASAGMVSSAYAASGEHLQGQPVHWAPSMKTVPRELVSGTSGSCFWTYAQVGDDVVLTIYPVNGKEGTLDDSYTWRVCNDYKGTTKRVVIKGTVKAAPNAESMFAGFKQAQSFDLSGLDVSEVTHMERMFLGCEAVTTLDLNGWDVSNVITMRALFLGCSALTSLNASDWDVSNVKIMNTMFTRCSALTSLDLSRWDMSRVVGMDYMFSGCSALTSLDVSTWKLPQKYLLIGTFANTRSLKEITLGAGFPIANISVLDDAGSSVGTKWMQVNLGKGGTRENPKGKVFESASDLIAFHCDRTLRETDVEMYIRVAPAEVSVSFNKGAEDATGEMAPQVYDPGAVEELTKNAYERVGYTFAGWKDSDGNVYADKHFFESDYFGKAVPGQEVSQRTFELVAQWKKR